MLEKRKNCMKQQFKYGSIDSINQAWQVNWYVVLLGIIQCRNRQKKIKGEYESWQCDYLVFNFLDTLHASGLYDGRIDVFIENFDVFYSDHCFDRVNRGHQLRYFGQHLVDLFETE